ncbi:hypothetical protein Ancab_022621, partial [Ancistrocladus abbreviatus]
MGRASNSPKVMWGNEIVFRLKYSELTESKNLVWVALLLAMKAYLSHRSCETKLERAILVSNMGGGIGKWMENANVWKLEQEEGGSPI